MTDGQVIATAHVSARDPGAGRALVRALGQGPFSCIMLFASPDADLDALLSEPGFGAPVIGCTTAGEISDEGYSEGGIVAMGLPAGHFDTELVFVPSLAPVSYTHLTLPTSDLV